MVKGTRLLAFVLVFLLLSSCSSSRSTERVPPTLPIRGIWEAQYAFINTQRERIDNSAVVRRFFAQPEKPFSLEPVKLAVQFERPTGGWIEVSFIETRPYETTSVSEIPADVEKDMFPLARLPLLDESELQQRRDVWQGLVVGPTEAIQRTAPLARDHFLDPFVNEIIEFVLDERPRQRFNKPAAWLIVYGSGNEKAAYWVDPTNGEILEAKYGAEADLTPGDYLPFPEFQPSQ